MPPVGNVGGLGVGCRVGGRGVGTGAGTGAGAGSQGHNCAVAGAGNDMARKDTTATTVVKDVEAGRDMIGTLWCLANSFQEIEVEVESSRSGRPVTTTKNEGVGCGAESNRWDEDTTQSFDLVKIWNAQGGWMTME